MEALSGFFPCRERNCRPGVQGAAFLNGPKEWLL
jgi:hypothetical protein